MKIRKALGWIVSAITLAASFASADIYTWNGTDGGTNDWQVAGNWLTNGVAAITTPGLTDTALFDTETEPSKTFTATNIPGDNLNTFLELRGDGAVSLSGAKAKMHTNKGFLATDGVSLNLEGGSRLYPYKGDTDSGATIHTVWASTGILDTDQSNSLGVYFNSAGCSFQITAGEVLINGSRMMGANNAYIYLDGGELKSTSLLSYPNGTLNSGIKMRGGDLTETGNMSWNAASDINIEDGIFTIGGKITFGALALANGAINFSTNSTGSFVSEHTEADILGFISSTNLTFDGAFAAADDFSIKENGGITTVSLWRPAVGMVISIQ